MMLMKNVCPPAPRGLNWRPLSERATGEIRGEAAKYRAMSETATTLPVVASLRKIADRLDELAARKEQASLAKDRRQRSPIASNDDMKRDLPTTD